MAGKKDPIQEVNELIETLMALAPTNNRISQFVLMSVGRGYHTIKEMYPDLVGDRHTRERVLKALGMKIGNDGKIETEYNALSDYLISIIRDLFDLFEREEVRDKITAALLNEKISNLHEDWVWARLKTIEKMSKEEGSPAAISILVLKVLKKLREDGGYIYDYIEIDKISENLGEIADKTILEEAIDILVKFGLLKQKGEKYCLSEVLWKYNSLIDDIRGE